MAQAATATWTRNSRVFPFAFVEDRNALPNIGDGGEESTFPKNFAHRRQESDFVDVPEFTLPDGDEGSCNHATVNFTSFD